MEFQQSKTYANVQAAFERELMVSTLYRIYSDRAISDEYIEIASVFDVTARNEFEHARIMLKQLNNGNVPPTQDNLLTSANTEVAAGALYREYSNTARDEGFTDLAALFNGLANIELNHDLRFRTLYNDVVRDQVVCKPEDTLWICMQCGNIMSGKCAPEICPVCGFPQGYYRVYTNLGM